MRAKAQRGDFMIYAVHSSYVALHGPSHSERSYRIAWVTGISRAGEVRAYVSPTGTVHKNQPAETLLVRHQTLSVPELKTAIARRDPYDDFESLDEIKAFVRPFVRS